MGLLAQLGLSNPIYTQTIWPGTGLLAADWSLRGGVLDNRPTTRHCGSLCLLLVLRVGHTDRQGEPPGGRVRAASLVQGHKAQIDQHAHSIFRFSALSVTLILTCWVEQSLLWKGPGDVNLSWENVEVIWLWHLLVWTAKVSWGMTFSPSLFHMPP